MTKSNLKQIPTLEVEEIDVNSAKNSADLKYIPAFIFDENITKTNFYQRAEELFTEKNGQYVFQATQVGFPVGQQLADLPTENSFEVGAENSAVVVFGVVSVDGEKSAIANPILDKFEVNYKNKVKFAYKIATDLTDEKSMLVSSAVFCADEQNGFDAFSDILFARQTKWKAIETTNDLVPVLAGYAVSSKLNKANFEECLSSGKYSEKVKEMSQEIADYGLTSAPIYFVNGEVIKGVPTYEGMKVVIDKALVGSQN
jgi:hypothetical protein